ncbi:MAG TPA: M28 family peptidase [Vicinamibacteria bacterium]|nr:M28 family peptidase [Vicinamibacteria bacterium]
MATVDALAGELSGESAKRNVEYLSRLHRMRASEGITEATAHVDRQLRAYGLEDVEVLRFPADGKTFYGTQKARPAWDAEFAELWEVGEDGAPSVRLASWEAAPITLAQDSESGEVTAELVDVGAGTSDRDYAGRDVRGKLVLASAQPGAVAEVAVARLGAAGIVSYAPNQRTAWWREDERLVRWGHLDSFTETKAFAFMVSLGQARALQARLGRGETVRLRAVVRAGRHPGEYLVATGTIPGADAKRREEEIAFTCHLDHPRPGANDNASGCATILEVARAIAKLVREGRIPRPARTLRFYWPPEIEGTTVLLNARRDLAGRIRAAVHMDMVGGGPETKAIFHVTRTPASLPSFVSDVAEAFGRFVNDQSALYAGTGEARWPLVAPEGGKEPLQADFARFTMGSDHQVFTESSFGIPAVYLNDWPDRYIHTNFDLPANIDPTKLKRAAFIGAATALYLAGFGTEQAADMAAVLRAHALRRAAAMLDRRAGLAPAEAANLSRAHWDGELALVRSMGALAPVPNVVWRDAAAFLDALQFAVEGSSAARHAPARSGIVYRRNAEPKGPMSVFGYDYFTDKYGADRARGVKLLSYQGRWGQGSEYAYEALNFVDGRRTVSEIRDALAAAYGPVPVELVSQYLEALATVGVVSPAR